jgi:hypothetical protein
MLQRLILVELSILMCNTITVYFFSYYIQPKIQMWYYQNKSWSYQISENYCLSLMTAHFYMALTSYISTNVNVLWSAQHKFLASLLSILYLVIIYLYWTSITFIVTNLFRMGRDNYPYEEKDEFNLRFLLTTFLVILNLLYNIMCIYVLIV